MFAVVPTGPPGAGKSAALLAMPAALDGVHVVLDSEQLTASEIAERIREARPDRLRR